MIKIPLDSLSPSALDGIVAEYVMREGTDYGDRIYSFAEKRAQVLAALQSGHAVITFDPVTRSTTILSADELSG